MKAEWGVENQIAVLTTPIERLQFTKEFKERSKLMGFQTLHDITSAAPKALMENDAFDYNWLGELVIFLTDRKLLYLLQPTPGNNPG